jgi:hypothetical protein
MLYALQANPKGVTFFSKKINSDPIGQLSRATPNTIQTPIFRLLVKKTDIQFHKQ